MFSIKINHSGILFFYKKYRILQGLTDFIFSSFTMSIQTQDYLISLLKQKDKKAIDILYKQYAKALYGVIVKIVEDKEISKDVLQEVFCKIWQKFPQYDMSKGRLFTWMLNIARNAAIDKTRSKDFKRRRQQERIEELIKQHPIQSPSLITSTQTNTIDIQNLTHNLKPKYKQVVELIYIRGYSQTETAEILQIPLGTVKTRVRTAILLMRKMIELYK